MILQKTTSVMQKMASSDLWSTPTADSIISQSGPTIAQLGNVVTHYVDEFHSQDSYITAHEGKEYLEINGLSDIKTGNFEPLYDKLSDMISDYVADTEMLSWLMPSFSTTTGSDNAVGAVIFMGKIHAPVRSNAQIGDHDWPSGKHSHGNPLVT